MNFDFAFVFSSFGLASLFYRLQPWRRMKFSERPSSLDWPFVSIIIPCRNEEKNLPTLLESLKIIDYPWYEIIVVDDHSTDQTFAIAQQAQVQIFKAPPKPHSWGGKNWPCFHGTSQAKGSLFLFTDADTIHAPSSLRKSVQYLQEQKADFISAPPFHACQKIWERFLGLFQLLPLIATAFRQSPSSSRVFAIGQYLLMTRSSYEELDGHKAIAHSLVDDIDLAKLWIEKNKIYRVYPDAGLYEVQMFSTFQTFLKGWKRLLRLGLGRSSLLSVLETTSVLFLFSLGFFETQLETALLSFVGIFVLAITQQRFGRFSIFGLLATPLNVLLFVGLSLAALIEALLRKDIQWHGRSYQRF